MKATIQLRQGDMFAQPTDLIIIPCSTAGTVTRAVAEQLQDLNIEWPRGQSNLGDVKFKLFGGASNLATYVGYATSVHSMETSRRAISKIAESVADFISARAEIRDVAIPLLGAGAGGLKPDVSLSALMEGFRESSVSGKVINIFVYNESDFERLSANQRKPQESNRRNAAQLVRLEREPPRVFISYTKTSAEHQNWVRGLATYMRENGVDARLDVWHLRPGMDLPQWMCNELDQADRVLIICNEEYASRANGRLGGVGWEIRLIQADLLHSQSSNPKKYVPMLKGRFHEERIPAFLRGVYSLDWEDDGANGTGERLLRVIFEALETAPAIGQPPRFLLMN